MKVKEMVEHALLRLGYDGLYGHSCGCVLGDLMPCNCETSCCEAGYKVPCPGPELCEMGGGCDWHIVPNRPKGS